MRLAGWWRVGQDAFRSLPHGAWGFSSGRWLVDRPGNLVSLNSFDSDSWKRWANRQRKRHKELK